MLNALIVVAIVLFFMLYDVLLRIELVVHRRRRQDILQEYAWRTVRRIVALFKTYGAFTLEFENRTIEGLPPRFLLVANHQSLMDIPILIHLLAPIRLRFVAKHELGVALPLVSLMLRAQGQALIRRRGDAVQAMNGLMRFARRCRRDGTCPAIFPEGTRSRDGRVGEFFTAGFRRMLETDPLPVVVVAIEGGWRISSLGTLLRNLRGTRYRVRILAVLSPPRGKKAIHECLETARRLVAEEVSAMRDAPSPVP
ncbi:MAG TPA: lysophospholipid acyltransferase family protein [Rectinemataceae bacterium]|nr:lysophospholipid acyltransferase family protein [Rectinemataceae bacterium]